MKKTSLLLLVLLPWMLISCGTSKFFAGKASDVKDIALIQPYSYLTDAIGNFSLHFIEEPSRSNSAILAELTAELLPVQQVVELAYDYSDMQSPLNKWLRALPDLSSGKARETILPAELLAAARSCGAPYALILSDAGYVKDPDQYTAEVVLESTMRVIDFLANDSLDLTKETEAYMNTVAALLIDTRSGKAVWYGSRPKSNKFNPLDKSSMERQLLKLFKDFTK